MKAKVDAGNESARWMFSLLERGLELGCLWRKRTRFYLNVAEAEQKTLCSGGHAHQLMRGRSKVHKTNWT